MGASDQHQSVAICIWALVSTLTMGGAGVVLHEIGAPAWAINMAWVWMSTFAGSALAAVVASVEER